MNASLLIHDTYTMPCRNSNMQYLEMPISMPSLKDTDARLTHTISQRRMRQVEVLSLR